jgi:hypothetical protein
MIQTVFAQVPHLEGKFDLAGRKIVVPTEEWYTVLGRKHAAGRRVAELTGVVAFSLMGTALYGTALAGPFGL